MFSFKKRKQSKQGKAKLEDQWDLALNGPDNVVDLSGCEMDHIPKGTYATCRVLLKEALLLNDNYLTSLKENDNDNEFGKLTCIRVLDLCNNQLHCLPPTIGNLANLQILNLENNHLTDIPDSIGDLLCLQTLNLKKNRLKALPDTICNLASLRTLDLSDNAKLCMLPSGLWQCRCLESITLDPATMKFPPSEVCVTGTSGIMKSLCEAAGSDYIPPSRAVLLNVLSQPGTGVKPQRTNSLKPTPTYDDGWDRSFEKTVEQYEKQKVQKEKEFVNLERTLQESYESHSALIANSLNHRNELIKNIFEEESYLSKRLEDVQSVKDKEKQKMLDILGQLEEQSSHLINDLKRYNEQARKMEKIFEEEERKRRAEDKWLEVKLQDHENLRKREVQDSVEQMLASYYGLEQLLEMQNRDKAKVIADNAIIDMNDSNNVLQKLTERDKRMKALLEELVRDEEFQKQAVEALLLQRDARNNRVNNQINIIEEELTKLTHLELKRQELNSSDRLNFLCEHRVELSYLLVQLLQEREQRKKEIRQQLIQMEKHKHDEQMDYWLVQYQRLIDSKPDSLLDAEAKLGDDIVGLLYESEAADFIPAFARHRITIDVLSSITEADLQKIGIYRLGTRRKLLANIEKFLLESVKCKKQNDKPEVPDEKPATKPEQAGASRVSTESPATDIVPARFEVECVVCIDRTSCVILIPCGHVCLCVECSPGISNCPMCRTDVKEKVQISSSFATNTMDSLLSATTPTPLHPNPSAPPTEPT